MSGKKNLKSITVTFLELLVDFASFMGEASMYRKATYRHLYDRTGGAYSRGDISRHVRNLERRGYLQKKQKDGQESVEFTNKAKIKVLDKFGQAALADNKNRFVSFDIPEPMRKERNQFRRAIKNLGFKQIQKSLWVINKNVGQLVELAAYEYDVEKYIIYIIAEKTDIDGIIEKTFETQKTNNPE